MQLLIAYLFWINVTSFAIMAYDRHNAYYALWRVPCWLLIMLACIGGIYGFLMAWLLFGWDKCRRVRPYIQWGNIDQPYTPPLNKSIDDAPIPGWGGIPINAPGLPPPDENVPSPPNPQEIVDLPSQEGGLRVAGNEIIVILDSDNAVPDIEHFLRRFRDLYPQEQKYRVNYYNVTTRLIRLLVPTAEREAVMERLERELSGEGLDFMLTDNYALNEDFIPSTPGFGVAGVKKYFDAIQAPQAWDITMGSSNVTVAIVDTFFATNHPDLAENWRDPINIVTQTRNVYPPAGQKDDQFNHGTHVAGIAVGSNKGQGSSGIAPNCKWIPIAVGKPIWSISILEGVLYAIFKGADVINISLGTVISDDVLKLPISAQFVRISKTGKRLETVWNYVTRLANERKCVIVWSAGNDNSLIALNASKRNNQNIKVSAVDIDGHKAKFSNHGNYDTHNAAYSTLSAPGVGIMSCVGNSGYARWDGTSMAAPIVTGAVALMKSIDRSLSPKEIIDILVATGRKTLPEEHIGPTVQIMDALLRVRRNLAMFNDVVSDKQTLLGSWEATKHLVMTNNDDEYLDDVLLFFHFSSSTSGELTMRSVNQGDVYHAPLSLDFKKDELHIVQQEEARCARNGVTPIRIYTYECKADKNGILLCTVRDNDSGSELFTFNLRKYKQ